MQYNIPEIGDKIRLTKSFTFFVHPDKRHFNLNTYLGRKGKNMVPIWTMEQWRRESKEVDGQYIYDLPSHPVKVKKQGHSGITVYADYNYQAYLDKIETYINEGFDFEQFCPLDKYGRHTLLFRIHGYQYTLPKNTELIIDRVYIRQGAEDFSSITFKLAQKPSVRFFVQIQELKTFHFIYIDHTTRADRLHGPYNGN